MSVKPGGGTPSYVSQFVSIAWASLLQLIRSPSHSRRADAAREWARHSLWLVTVGGLAIAALMFLLDAREIALMPARGTGSLWLFRIITDFGKSAYVLEVLAALSLIVLFAAPIVEGSRRLLLMAFGVRLQFLFFAVFFPVVVGEIIKVIVGRGRPFVGGGADVFNFSHFAWTETYASFPSGHAITSAALAFAVSAVWPKLRVAMIGYVLVIAVSRLVLLAHHPSDVVAGAILGVIGAMFVRYWFAARHLGFTIHRDGSISSLAAPSWQFIKTMFASRSPREATRQDAVRPAAIPDEISER